MSTLISVHNSNRCVGRCDAACYDAKTPDCDCVCNGANHGKGYHAAWANTYQTGLAMAYAFALAHPDLDATWYKTDGKPQQLRQQQLF